MQTIWRPTAATPTAIIMATISTSDITTYKTTVKLPELHFVPLLCLKASLQSLKYPEIMQNYVL